MNKYFNYLVPLRVHGEGHYQLTSVKDVKVTQEFLSLNIEDKKCQHETTLDECRTKMYLSKMRNICKCFPYGIWAQEKVCFKSQLCFTYKIITSLTYNF